MALYILTFPSSSSPSSLFFFLFFPLFVIPFLQSDCAELSSKKRGFEDVSIEQWIPNAECLANKGCSRDQL